jgi:ABC-type sugar transport system ATPase subunit
VSASVPPDGPLLQARQVVKAFGGVQALKGVDFAITAGRVHGLVGENGAGKSTLLKILAGVYGADSGEVRLADADYAPTGTDEALRRGIVTIHQDINLIANLTVAENILLNNEPTAGKLGFLRRASMRERALALLHRYGVEVDPGAVVSSLPNDVKKMVQILKAIAWDARILLMDEPTSSLTDVEVRVVLKLIRSLAGEGVAVIFVSHYLAEIFEVCDEITVMRDGRIVASTPRAQTSLPEVVRGMLGRSLEQAHVRRTSVARPETLLSVSHLSAGAALRDISFELHKGEVLGVTGLTGSGLGELARAIFGAEDIVRTSGTFAIDGRPVRLSNPGDSLRNGVALLTGDRLREGILLDFSLTDNVTLPILDRLAGTLGWLDRSRLTATGRRCIDRLRVRAPGPDVAAKTLSGGNQQKLLIAKWLETSPKILLLDEPTIGVDVGSKFEIRGIIEEIAATGVGIVLFSAELADIETLCDRVLVMFRGSVVGTFAGDAIVREDLLQTSVSGRLAA